MLGRGGYFRKCQAGVAPGDHVAGAGDVDFGRILSPLDRAGFEDLKEFGVQRTPIELKRQLGDFWSDGEHDEASLI